MSKVPLKPTYEGASSNFTPMENHLTITISCKAKPISGLPPRCPTTGSQPAVLTNRPASASKYPSTPNLATAERAGRRHNSGAESENKKETAQRQLFAKPVNHRLLESPTVGVRKQKPRSPTRPKEFALKTALRASFRTKSDSDLEPQQDLTKCFKALPLPSDTPDRLPPKRVRPPTVPLPFRLRTDQIDAEHKEKQRKMVLGCSMEEEEEKRRKAAEFRAKIMPDFSRPVFCPVVENRHTEPDNVQLNTIRRAEERKNFDEQLKAREAELNEVLRQRELEKQREDEEMVRKMRAEMVHRAQPVKRFKPVEIKHDVEITVPKTPKFHSDRRLLERPPSRNGMISQKK